MITKKQKQWFTLVELIVVITILSILWLIAFISLQWYSKSARDSARISDMSRIKSSLELFMVEAGKYPEPTDAVAVTYSGTTEAWNQGAFGENTFRVVERLDKKPVDPTTDKEYTYSVTNSRKEYQLGWILETTDFAYHPLPNPPLSGEGIIGQANAWETLATARIIWNYNGQMLKVLKGNDLTILAAPSIICSEDLTFEECIAQNKLAYDGYKNLPPSFAGTQYKQLWEAWSLNLVNNTADIVIYEWKKSDLVEDSDAWKLLRRAMVEKLQAAYSSTKIASREWIRRLVNVVIEDDAAVESLWVSIVNNKINSGMITASKLSVESSTTSTSWTQVEENSCSDILLNNPSSLDGVYTIWWIEVYCDMTNGGWTRVIYAPNGVSDIPSYSTTMTINDDPSVAWVSKAFTAIQGTEYKFCDKVWDLTQYNSWWSISMQGAMDSWITVHAIDTDTPYLNGTENTTDSWWDSARLTIFTWTWYDFMYYNASSWSRRDGVNLELNEWSRQNTDNYTWWCWNKHVWVRTTPTYSDCSATIQNNYNIPALTHWETQKISKTMDVTNGTQAYTQDFTCTDGQVAWSNEVAGAVSCSDWFTLNNWVCEEK